MSGEKLIIRFHDPNPPERTAKALLELFCQAGNTRLQQALQEEPETTETGCPD